MSELETSFREAALRCGSNALSKLLSEIPDEAQICPKCDKPMENLDRRGKHIVTLLGDCEYSRCYYGCDCGEHSIPKDEILGVSGTSFTRSVRRVTAQIAASDSFRDTSANLSFLCGIKVSAKDSERIAEGVGSAIINAKRDEIMESLEGAMPPAPDTPIKIMYIEYDGTGVPIRKPELVDRKGKQPDGSAKTREMKTGCIFTQSGWDDEGKPVRDADSTTYFSQIGELEDFSDLLYSEAVKRGVDYAYLVVVLGDGSKWIWNLAKENFPNAVQIIDLFHAKEHICDLLKKHFSDEAIIQVTTNVMYKLLENGDIEGLVDAFGKLPSVTKEQCEKVRLESAYFINNKERMRYNVFIALGLFVGSGVIEAACKNVIGKRLKQSGMLWSVDGANSISALRCSVLSGEFDLNYVDNIIA